MAHWVKMHTTQALVPEFEFPEPTQMTDVAGLSVVPALLGYGSQRQAIPQKCALELTWPT